jgi:hypothetical protein
MSKRRTHSPEFKARVAMEAISGRKTIQEIASDHAIHPIQVSLVERLWRTVKYEEVYIHAYSDGWEAEISLARFLWRYCHVGLPEKVNQSPTRQRRELEWPGACSSRGGHLIAQMRET